MNTILLRMLFTLCMACLLCTVAMGVAWGDGTWADELANSLSFYQANYPHTNWDPYLQKLTTVQDAVGRGDQRTVKAEMGKWFKMLRNREHGISEIAADELYNFAVMVTPLQEYGISLPAPMPGL
ncbi:MAG TPA: hypothetical protein VJ692_11025 [Nitrospiraceae bacterium]|nr:hypothetical protein [Nitrospiraceae bacterium]